MVEDDYFEPIIFVCPVGRTDPEFFSRSMTYETLMRTYNHFKDSDYDYNVVNAYDEDLDTFKQGKGEFLDIDKHYSIDLVFFQVPYGYTKVQYFVHYWCQRALTCFSYYGYNVCQELNYNQVSEQKFWKFFLEGDIQRKMSLAHSSMDTYNTEVVGYCFADQLDPNKTYKNLWKTTGLKRIIWAPHHYAAPKHNYSAFHTYGKFMLQLAQDYKDKIEIVFRPHPGLRESMYNDSQWGKAKTDAYYDKWSTMKNTQLSEDDYLDYFFTSDAMILDSQSFMAEYLYTGKPSLYTVREGITSETFNEFGSAVFDVLYKSYSTNDVIKFVDNIVNDGDDPQKEARQNFFDKYLNIATIGSPSQNIIDFIKKTNPTKINVGKQSQFQ